MAVAYKGSAFGSSDHNITVADPIVISSSLPRFLSPNDQNTLANIQGTLAQLQQENYQDRVRKHLEDRADEADLMKTIAGLKGKGSVFNMKGADGINQSFSALPQDQQVINDKADSIRKMIFAHPKDFDHNDDIYKAQDELDTLTAQAGVRAIHAAKNNIAAQQSNNPLDRKGYQDNTNAEITQHPLTDFHNPDPYFTQPTWDPNNVTPATYFKDSDNYDITTTNIPKDPTKTGDYDKKITTTRLKPSAAFPVNRFEQMVNTQAPGSLDILQATRQFLQSTATNPQRLQDLDNKIVENNAATGQNVPTIGAVDPTTGQYKIKDPTNTSAGKLYAQIFYADNALKGETKTEPTDFYQKEAIEKERLAAEKEKERHDRVDETQKQFALDHPKPTGASIKDDEYRKGGEDAVNEVANIYDAKNYTQKIKPPLVYADKKEPNVSGDKVKHIISSVMPGLDPEKNDYYSVPKGLGAEKLIGLEAPKTVDAQGALHKTTTTTDAGNSADADKILMQRNKQTKEGTLIYIKDNKVVATVPQKTGAENLVKNNLGYDLTTYENREPWIHKAYNDKTNPSATQAAPAQNAQSSSYTYEGGPVEVRPNPTTGKGEAYIGGKWMKVKKINHATGVVDIQ